MSHILVKDYGVIAAALAEGLIKDATSTELPNAETNTYTPDTDGTSPSDATTRYSVVSKTIGGVATALWDLATARNVVTVVTHSSAVVAMTVLYFGYDEYMEPMTELHTITSGTTSKTVTGKKAFRYVRSIAITAAGNAEANTLDAGTGVVIGLPAKIAGVNAVLNVRMDGADDATATIVAGVGTTAGHRWARMKTGGEGETRITRIVAKGKGLRLRKSGG